MEVWTVQELIDGVEDKKEIASPPLPACASAVAWPGSYMSKQIIIIYVFFKMAYG